MSNSVDAQLRFLRIYAVTSSIVLVVLCTSAFRQAKSSALDELTVGRINIAVNKITDSAERETALAAIRASAPPSPRRLFAGKTQDRSAIVSLADAAGKPRLNLTVGANGDPRIEFLDETGKVVARLPQK